MSHKFRLAVVLRLREMAEETARIDLAHAVAAHQASLSAVEAAEHQVGEELGWLSRLQHERTEAGQFRTACDAVSTGRRRADVARQHLVRQSDALFEARRRLADARRRREVVERLRDRFMAAERREADRRDVATMAEIASTRHAMRSLENPR